MASPVGLVRASQPSRLRIPHSSCVKVGGSSEKWEPYDAKVSRTVLREGLELVQPERCCSLVLLLWGPGTQFGGSAAQVCPLGSFTELRCIPLLAQSASSSARRAPQAAAGCSLQSGANAQGRLIVCKHKQAILGPARRGRVAKPHLHSFGFSVATVGSNLEHT